MESACTCGHPKSEHYGIGDRAGRRLGPCKVRICGCRAFAAKGRFPK